MTSNVAAPANAVCSQKISRQLRNVTMMPPMKGPVYGQTFPCLMGYKTRATLESEEEKDGLHLPRAGPIKVPLRNHPNAVPRSVWITVSSTTAK